MAPHGTDALVERQMRRWDIRRKAERDAERKTGTVAWSPSIALSRQPYAGGGDLGRLVADRLDYGLFGREILEEIEKHQGIRRGLLESLDERLRGKIERYVVDVFRDEAFRESDYLAHLLTALRTIGERGLAVVLGRGAQFVLPPDRTLRVLAVAPFGFRAENLAEREGLDRAAAEAQLRRADRERDEFLRLHFRREQTDPSHYDLCVNLGTLSTIGAVGLVLGALGDRFPHAV